MKLILYHNNNCSKSRMCKKILEEKNINFESREYLKDLMTKEEIKNILSNLEDDLGKIIRDKNLTVDNEKVSINRLTKLIFAKPNIMQRPIVFYKKFYICRPPEKILEIIGYNYDGGGSRI